MKPVVLQQDIYLMAEHLLGKENLMADKESGTMKDHCDWMLNLIIFNQIQLQMGPCELDLFVSCLTRQLTRFYSWRPHPEAGKTDAFNQDWSTTEGFANPVWCLIAKFLSQTKQQQARLIMIAPLWGHPTMAPNQSGNVGGLSMCTSSETRFSHTPNTSG